MKKTITVLMLICCLIFSISAASAAGALVSAELDVNDFGIDVTASGLTPLGRISVYARPAGSGIASSLEAGSGVYAQQFFASADGGFEAHISFVPGAESGEYIVSVADEATAMVHESEVLVYRTQADMEDAIKAINQASAQTMTKAIDDNKDVLLLDTTEFDSMTLKDDVAKMLVDVRPAEGFKTAAELHKAFGACVASVEVTVTDEPEALIRKYADELGIDSALLDDCSKDEITEAMKILQDKEYSIPDELKKAFPEAVFAGKVNAASTAGEIRELFLETYADELNLDLKDYNKLSSPSKIFVEIKNDKVTGFDDAKEKFEDAVNAQKKKEDSGSSGGSGGSGGGGGGYPVVPSEMQTQLQSGNQTAAPVFGDLGSVLWAKEDIEYLNSKGIVSGDGNGAFRPNDTVTRAEFVKMITLAFGFESVSNNTEFTDVAPNSWYASYVAAGVNAGIINGIGGGLFAPDANITREDLTLICYRAVSASKLILDKVNGSAPADSALVSDYASEAVDAFFKAGIISGDPSGAFRPKDGATRAEVSKIIAGLMRLKEVQG